MSSSTLGVLLGACFVAGLGSAILMIACWYTLRRIRMWEESYDSLTSQFAKHAKMMNNIKHQQDDTYTILARFNTFIDQYNYIRTTEGSSEATSAAASAEDSFYGPSTLDILNRASERERAEKQDDEGMWARLIQSDEPVRVRPIPSENYDCDDHDH